MALLTDEDIKARIESPLNLMNRLRVATTNKNSGSNHPALPPKIDDLVSEVNDKLAENSIKAKASSILIAAMDELKNRITDIHKPEKLSAIAKDMSNVIESQNKKSKSDDSTSPQIVIYSPRIRNENEFNIIHVSE